MSSLRIIHNLKFREAAIPQPCPEIRRSLPRRLLPSGARGAMLETASPALTMRSEFFVDPEAGICASLTSAV
jgi:hypothetical protein